MAHDLEAAPRSGKAGEEILQPFAAALHARGNDPRGDDGRLEKTEVVACIVEDLAQIADLGRGFQVHAGETQNGLVDHPEVGLHRRLRLRIAAVHGQVDRNVHHPGAFRIIHAEKEDVAPRAVAQVHADRGLLVQERIEAVGSSFQKLVADSERMIHRMAGAEHPLVALHRPDAAPDLIGQGLEAELPVGLGQGARYAVAGAVLLLPCQKEVDRLLEPPLKEVDVAGVGDQARLLPAVLSGQVETMHGVEEEERAHPFVEVVAAPSEALEAVALID